MEGSDRGLSLQRQGIKSIFSNVKAKRLQWAEHVQRMNKENIV
jgi:hypothetical protein